MNAPSKLLSVVAAVAVVSCAHDGHKAKSKSLEEVAPMTAASVGGHRSLYKDGFFIVNSTEKTFDYAREHMGEKSLKSVKRAGEELSETGRNFAGAVVNEDVPPHTVVAGVPAKIIRTIDGKHKPDRGKVYP